ncbi:MAG: DUF4870 domain-containing protein, partial [Janthinobacterium lividum]
EGFPAPGSSGSTYEPVDTGYGQPPTGDAPAQGYEQQAPAYEQQPYGGQQPYVAQGQQPYPGQQPYVAHGQQPYPGQQAQQPYPYQQPYQQPYPGQQPYVPQAQHAAYPGQGYPAQPYLVPMSESDQRLWATLTHLSTLVVGFVGPLVAYLVLKDRSPFLKESTTEALNFSITASLAVLVSSILTVIVVGYVLLPFVYIGALVLCILAAVAGNKGEVYRYPLSWRLVK